LFGGIDVVDDRPFPVGDAILKSEISHFSHSTDFAIESR
jgi:hypothetical protein